jgi:hypothetical protein
MIKSPMTPRHRGKSSLRRAMLIVNKIEDLVRRMRATGGEGASLRSFGNLVLQVAGLMIAVELAQRCLVQLKQNLAQFLGLGITGCETLSVNLPERADQGVPVFVADLAIPVAVAAIEAWHASLP